MKPNNPKFWKVLSAVYLVFLLIIILIYNPDFSDVKNWALFIPLYAPLVFSVYLKYKNDENASDTTWETRWILLIFTGIVAVFKLIANYFE